jgi:hypothetical protein
MQTRRIRAVLPGLMALALSVFALGEAAAGPLGLGGALPHQALAKSVLVWKDCQRIAPCTGCRPVYRCRSCKYQRTCRNNFGMCGWTDVCVWGPYLPVAPRGVPIFAIVPGH